ncbi:MAG TPA: YihA family ribosome biogenesis GTP-binding protein [Clostridiales bacterium]|nr:YihA family ribosome biogenesis GTP-binding protein [Clostridiales bacterium]
MIIKSVELLMTAGNASQYPETDFPEIAFAGRSNVGKSSLLNTLINRKNYARTSGQPGKTQTINFYAVNETNMLVDLPGYGYAKASKRERERWGKMIESFLLNRKQLKGIMLLIDIRHVPGQNDVDMFNWITHFGYDYYILATKADKISKGKRQKHIAEIKKALAIDDVSKIIPFSSVERLNRDLVWEKIIKLSNR